MAIKERKQITGTTAQINAYEGHEGQIVWDKEKKTLVGMSGTAGKNYPLAQKSYVDNEVAKVNTEVAKKTSSAELTQELAGKEDKGVCLPLTGGTLTGPLFLTETNHILAVADELYKGLELGGGSTFKNGASLFLRNNNATGPEESGQWGLAAHNATSEKEGLLVGTTDNILFNGKVVERADGFYTAQFEDGFCNVHRYATGLQIVSACFTIPGTKKKATLTFTKPFIDNSYSIAFSGTEYTRGVIVTWDTATTTGINLYKRDYSGTYGFNARISCTFIGRWL